MEPIFVLISFGDLVLNEIADEGDEFRPKSEFRGGTNASGVFCCLLCHALRMRLKQLLGHVWTWSFHNWTDQTDRRDGDGNRLKVIDSILGLGIVP